MFVGTVNQITELVTDYIRLSTLRSRAVVEGSLNKIADLISKSWPRCAVLLKPGLRNYDFDDELLLVIKASFSHTFLFPVSGRGGEVVRVVYDDPVFSLLRSLDRMVFHAQRL